MNGFFFFFNRDDKKKVQRGNAVAKDTSAVQFRIICQAPGFQVTALYLMASAVISDLSWVTSLMGIY